MTDFSDVYDHHFKDVYRYVLSLCRSESLAEDLTQETFIKALKSIDGFDGKCRLYVWLCQIAKNTYFSYLAKESRIDRNGGGEEEMPGPSLETRFLSRETAFEVYSALHRLDEPYKEVFTLRFFGELPFLKIAQLFGKTESWARVTYHRARLKIREELS